MAGPGYLDQVSGAQSVTASSTHGGHDQANLYDGHRRQHLHRQGGHVQLHVRHRPGAGRSSTRPMASNSIPAFARHAGDTAYIYAGAGYEDFVCDALSSTLTATNAAGALIMLDTTLGFSRVYAFGNPGDTAHVHNATVNVVTGFTRLP